MFQRQRTGSVLCPSCGSLVGVNDDVCLSCGRRRPGLWGFAALLRNVGEDMGFFQLILWTCGALYLACLAVDLKGVASDGLLTFLSPSGRSSFLFGMSGSVPVFFFGRWWTVLSAGWLHGGIVHIMFNMMALRTLLPGTAQLYGPGRTVIIYTAACVSGFLATSVVGHYFTFLPGVLKGAPFTLGASASLFGLIGALSWYGRRGGSSMVTEVTKRWLLAGIVFGFVVPGIDNWAHLGGYAGGWLVARWLDPLLPERGDHVMVAAICLALSAAAVVLSFVVGLPPGL